MTTVTSLGKTKHERRGCAEHRASLATTHAQCDGGTMLRAGTKPHKPIIRLVERAKQHLQGQSTRPTAGPAPSLHITIGTSLLRGHVASVAATASASRIACRLPAGRCGKDSRGGRQLLSGDRRDGQAKLALQVCYGVRLQPEPLDGGACTAHETQLQCEGMRMGAQTCSRTCCEARGGLDHASGIMLLCKKVPVHALR